MTTPPPMDPTPGWGRPVSPGQPGSVPQWQQAAPGADMSYQGVAVGSSPEPEPAHTGSTWWKFVTGVLVVIAAITIVVLVTQGGSQPTTPILVTKTTNTTSTTTTTTAPVVIVRPAVTTQPEKTPTETPKTSVSGP